MPKRHPPTHPPIHPNFISPRSSTRPGRASRTPRRATMSSGGAGTGRAGTPSSRPNSSPSGEFIPQAVRTHSFCLYLLQSKPGCLDLFIAPPPNETTTRPPPFLPLSHPQKPRAEQLLQFYTPGGRRPLLPGAQDSSQSNVAVTKFEGSGPESDRYIQITNQVSGDAVDVGGWSLSRGDNTWNFPPGA
jgi:hypothetical protein